RILAVLQSLLIGNRKPNRLSLESRIVAGGDLTDFFAVELIEAEWRGRPADVDLTRHHGRQRWRRPPSLRRLCRRQPILLDEGRDDPVGGRAACCKGDGPAVDVPDRLDRPLAL